MALTVYTVSQKTSYLWFAITLTHVNRLLAEMLPIKSAIKRQFTMPPQLTCVSALPGKTETRKLQFSLAVLVHCQSLLDFFNLFDSRLILTLLYDSLSHVINAFTLGLLGGMVLKKGSRERCSCWTELHAQNTSAVFWVSSFVR